MAEGLAATTRKPGQDWEQPLTCAVTTQGCPPSTGREAGSVHTPADHPCLAAFRPTQ